MTPMERRWTGEALKRRAEQWRTRLGFGLPIALVFWPMTGAFFALAWTDQAGGPRPRRRGRRQAGVPRLNPPRALPAQPSLDFWKPPSCRRAPAEAATIDRLDAEESRQEAQVLRWTLFERDLSARSRTTPLPPSRPRRRRGPGPGLRSRLEPRGLRGRHALSDGLARSQGSGGPRPDTAPRSPAGPPDVCGLGVTPAPPLPPRPPISWRASSPVRPGS